MEDIVAVQIFQSWANGSAWKTDLINQSLINLVGRDKAQQIAQITINPDDGTQRSADFSLAHTDNLSEPSSVPNLEFIADGLAAGSNAWASGSQKSKNGKPIFANNPHLPATTLPGFWLPMGLFTPGFAAVGVTAPGSPGIGVGRTSHIAYGATVGGSDGADVYIETLHPNGEAKYLHGDQWHDLALREETLQVKDGEAEQGFRREKIIIRETPRGPIISDHGFLAGLKDKSKALSLRWAARNLNQTSLGSDRLLTAKNTQQAIQAMRLFPGALSHIVADNGGNIARVSSGRVPIRLRGDGSTPIEVQSLQEFNWDNWQGLIPNDELPMQLNPAPDWVGTANQSVVPNNYPYQYSKNFATSWRYRRIKQVMEASPSLDWGAHWSLIHDIYNPMADKLVPIYIEAFEQRQDEELAELLRGWDRNDTTDSSAAALFQVLTKHLASKTFADEITGEIWAEFFDKPYYWQERLLLMLSNNEHDWFDDVTTDIRETRDDILQLAIDDALKEIKSTLGNDPDKWQWGDLHKIRFDSPVIPGKLAARLFGGGTHPMVGSGETLNRSAYQSSKGYQTYINDSVRFVADLSDSEKVTLNLPGGISARYFDSTLTNQVDRWLSGEPVPVWFTAEKAKAHATSELRFEP